MKTTNYYDAFIAVSEDCPARKGEVPTEKNREKTIAGLQYEMIKNNPYQYTSDEVIFDIHARRTHVHKSDQATERESFFSRGQACLRSSPLVKRYGWGIHSDQNGRVALFAVESKEYQKLLNDKTIRQLKGMRSKRS